MSENLLHVVPTDPFWRPSADVADRAAAVVARLVAADSVVTVEFHRAAAFIHSGSNLERVECPHCGANLERWADLMPDDYDDGFDDLAVRLPCCGADTSLDTLRFDWPCAFGCIDIAARNPGRSWLTDDELATIADALGHRVRQVMQHI
ncbi:hypothetical protein [Amycolatopsis sacchari]|uniref:hypothetical protein n=1 Tax=Amycolatopsis sacchari TaxID=115433 RepID=UPI003EC09906